MQDSFLTDIEIATVLRVLTRISDDQLARLLRVVHLHRSADTHQISFSFDPFTPPLEQTARVHID